MAPVQDPHTTLVEGVVEAPDPTPQTQEGTPEECPDGSSQVHVRNPHVLRTPVTGTTGDGERQQTTLSQTGHLLI